MTILLKRISIQLLTALVFLIFSPHFAIAGNAAAGKETAILCVGCHGEKGVGVSPEIPNLAGQKKTYLVNTLKDFRAGVRKNPIMNSMVKTLSDSDVENLAAYFSSLK